MGSATESATVPNGPPARLQDLPPGAAHLCLGIERFCRDALNLDLSGRALVAAYSGGADSRALLFILHYLAPRLGVVVQAAVLDHGLRPESAREAEDAARVCAGLGVPLHAGKRDVAALARERGIGLEEAGRLARLEFLESVRLKTGAAWIAVGHQLNDLAEDCVMRMLRGAGWPALAGMAAVSPEFRIIRPLLLTPRADLERFLTDIGQKWHTDAMNEDDAYLRNRVRKTVIPALLAENPAFLDTVADRWRMAREDAAFFDAATDGVHTVAVEGGTFVSHGALAAEPPSVRLRFYMKVLSRLGPGQATAVSLHALDAAWTRGEGGKTVQFPGGKRATIRDGGVFFSKE